MAQPIVVTFEGAESSFALQRMDRSRLYGRRERIHLDPTGARCQRAALTDDGSLLLVPGMTAQGYFDPQGNWIPNNTLVGITPEGEPAETVPSTLGAAQPLSPLPATGLLDLAVSSVYALEPEELDEALSARLVAGELFSFPFAYRAGYNSEVGVLVANEEGVFALIGRPRPSDWSELAQIVQPLEDDDEDDLDDDLDFQMF